MSAVIYVPVIPVRPGPCSQECLVIALDTAEGIRDFANVVLSYALVMAFAGAVLWSAMAFVRWIAERRHPRVDQ